VKPRSTRHACTSPVLTMPDRRYAGRARWSEHWQSLQRPVARAFDRASLRSTIDRMSPFAPHYREVAFGPAGAMRLLTVVLALLLVISGTLAAQHAQTSRSETDHTLLAESNTAHQPPAAEADSAANTVGEYIAVGLASGCIVIIICCVLGMALLAGRTLLFKLFVHIWRRVRTNALVAIAAVTPAPRPCLVTLSISRT